MGCKPRGRRFCLQFALKYCMLVIKTARQSCKGRACAARDLAFTAHLPYTAGPGIPGPYTSTKEKAIMQIIEITDLSIPELAPYTKLTESQLRNRLEPEKGIFIAESPKVIGTALDAGCEPLSFLMERRQIDGPAAGVLARCPDATVYTADRSVLQVLTGYVLTRGVLCAMRRPRLPNLEDICAGAARIVVLDNVQNPINVGAIFPSAAALGMDAVLLTPGCSDPLYRRSARVSMGTVFQIPWTFTGDWPREGMEQLNRLGFRTAAMALSDDSVSIDDRRLMAEEKLAVILGSEGDGLTETTIARCDYTVKIPMYHGVDSLNVAAASAVAFWQLRKEK